MAKKKKKNKANHESPSSVKSPDKFSAPNKNNLYNHPHDDDIPAIEGTTSLVVTIHNNPE